MPSLRVHEQWMYRVLPLWCKGSINFSSLQIHSVLSLSSLPARVPVSTHLLWCNQTSSFEVDWLAPFSFVEFCGWPKIAISLRTCAHQCGEVSAVGSQVVDGRHQCSTQRMRGGNATFSQQHQTHPRRTIHDVWFQAPAGETRDEKSKRSQFWGLTEHFKAKFHIS